MRPGPVQGRLAAIAVLLATVNGLATADAGVGADERSATPPPVATLPAERGGQDLIGVTLADLRLLRRLDDHAGPGDDAARSSHPPRATLYRWWTDSCSYCDASLPAIETLRRRYASDGLRVIAVYHPKPPRRVRDDAVRRAAGRRGYHGELAIDDRWTTLRRVYLDARPRRATSVSILVDADGVVRFVHPGPVLFPSDDPAHAQENDDFELLDRAIRALVDVRADEQADAAQSHATNGSGATP